MTEENELSEVEMRLNYNMYKERSVYYSMAIKQMLRAIIKKAPKEILIDVLKSEKIIKQDWSKDGTQYVEVKKCS